jgi:uncharacterized protein (DUF58 family)
MSDLWRKYFDPRTLARLDGLQLRARRVVEGYVAGLHRSPIAGQSIEFAQHREYVPGDDLRQVDWKVYGRTDKYYLKQYEAETNLIGHLLLDASESMAYRGPQAAMSKYAYAQCMIAALAYIVVDRQDAASLQVFDQTIGTSLPAAGNRGQLSSILEAIDRRAPQGPTQIAAALALAAERLRHRGIVIVVSDLLDDPEAIGRGLEQLRHRGHELIVLQVMDPDEVNFPFELTTRFEGLEAIPAVTVDPMGLRRAYLDEVAAHREQIESTCRRLEADFRVVLTDQPLHLVLPPLLAARSRTTS